jgi:lipopolysaccharide/colanic/teichoic acid biosynthesis glycosyltransferase
MAKRFSDIFFSALFLLLLFIPMLLIGVAVTVTSIGGVFFSQKRVGKLGVPFLLLKFRTMRPYAESEGLITVGERDPRVTRIGHFLRKSKLDELPQLINIFKGEMSFIGPRPEVPKYVAMYTEEQMRVLRLRPGLSDPASLAFFNESEILGQQDDPEAYYVEVIMPAKLKMNLEYVMNRRALTDLKLVFKTIKLIAGL